MCVPKHWRPGQVELALEDADDKARYGRVLPLSRTAVDALDAACAMLPDDDATGLLFGRHNFSKHLKRAAKKVLGEHDGARFAAYDFRHGRGTILANEGESSARGRGTSMGHKLVTTTNRYLHPNKRQAEAALAVVG